MYKLKKNTRGDLTAGIVVIIAVAILVFVLLTNWKSLSISSDKTKGVDNFMKTGLSQIDSKDIPNICKKWRNQDNSLLVSSLKYNGLYGNWEDTKARCCQRLSDAIAEAEKNSKTRIQYSVAEECINYCNRVVEAVEKCNDGGCIQRVIDEESC